MFQRSHFLDDFFLNKTSAYAQPTHLIFGTVKNIANVFHHTKTQMRRLCVAEISSKKSIKKTWLTFGNTLYKSYRDNNYRCGFCKYNCRYYNAAANFRLDFFVFLHVDFITVKIYEKFHQIWKKTFSPENSIKEKQCFPNVSHDFHMQCPHNLRTWSLVRWKTLAIFFTVPKIKCVGWKKSFLKFSECDLKMWPWITYSKFLLNFLNKEITLYYYFIVLS